PVARKQLRLAAGLRKFVPWADGETIVAAVDAVAHERAQVPRDRALVLDREVGDAAARIQPIWRRERRRRTYVEAGAAGATMIALGRVGRQLKGGEDGAEKQPRAILARDEIGVLALPAEASGLRQWLLHHGRGIDKNLSITARL